LGFGRILAGNWRHFCLVIANLEKRSWKKPSSRRKEDGLLDLNSEFFWLDIENEIAGLKFTQRILSIESLPLVTRKDFEIWRFVVANFLQKSIMNFQMNGPKNLSKNLKYPDFQTKL